MTQDPLSEENCKKAKPLSGREALELARKGSAAWNEWASSNPDRTVDFSNVDFSQPDTKSIQFSDFIFPGLTLFKNAKFNYISFKNSKFKGKVKFSGSIFTNDCDFSSCYFYKDAEFNHILFKGISRFISSKFYNRTVFTGTKFQSHALFMFISMYTIPRLFSIRKTFQFECPG